MPKKNFKATEGLLHDVMRKQSGVIEKAWLEALMNSVDAGASQFTLEVEESTTKISDDGDSMTSDEVEKYFEQFGLKDDDIQDKEFGKFRMGRGQIFNFGVNIWRAKENYMVVSLDDEEVSVTLKDCTETEDESIIGVEDDDYHLNTSGISYALLEAESVEQGIEILVEHYEPIEDLDDTIGEFKDLARYVSWVHGINVEVNGEKVGEEPDVVQETDNAWFADGEDSFSSRSPVYNKGAYVSVFKLGPRRMTIISKDDLDVTLDRKDILETDDYWKTLQEEYKSIITEQLVEEDELSKSERNWLLEQAAEDPGLAQVIHGKPIVEDVQGEMWSISGLSNKNIGFAFKDDTVAEEANEQPGVVILIDRYEDSLKTFVDGVDEMISNSELKSYSEIVDEEMAFEMDEVDEEGLSKRRSSNLRMLRRALSDLGFSDTVKPGYSNHKNVWKDDEENLYIHKDYLNESKTEIATNVFFEVVKVAAHDGDTRAGMSEDYNLSKNFYKMVNGDKVFADKDFPTVQRKLLSGDYK